MAKRVLFVSGQTEKRKEIESGFRAYPEVNLYMAETLEQAESTMISNRFGLGDLVILDERIDGRSAIDASRDIVLKNAFVSLVLINDLPRDRFHEMTEGLGILAQFPSRPSAADFETLMHQWDAVSSVSGG